MNSASSPHDLTAQLRGVLADLAPPPPWWVAYSGGPDSLALLASLRQLTDDLRAVHVDHNLHSESAVWARRAGEIAATLGVDLRIERVAVRDTGEGLEAAARAARYAVFEQLLADGGSLFLAHHADDQAETQLLQLLRGGGLAGLAGMPRQRALGAGRLVRPLLDQPRAALRRAAAASGCDWIEDPANDDPSRDRNFLHHRVMPVLAERWPDAAKRLSRSAGDAAQNLVLLRELADAYLSDLGTCLPLGRLRSLDPDNREWFVRYWLNRQGVRPPGRHRLAQGLADLVNAAHDARPVLAWPEAQLRRHADTLYLLPRELPATFQAVVMTPELTQELSDGSCLRFQSRAGGMATTALDEAIRIRPRQGGERLPLHGQRRSVKKLLQEAGVPPWEKAVYPILWSREQIVALPGIAVADGWRARVGRWPVWTPAWQR